MKTLQEVSDYLWGKAMSNGAQKLTNTAEILGIKLETDPEECTIEDLKNPEEHQDSLRELILAQVEKANPAEDKPLTKILEKIEDEN